MMKHTIVYTNGSIDINATLATLNSKLVKANLSVKEEEKPLPPVNDVSSIRRDRSMYLSFEDKLWVLRTVEEYGIQITALKLQERTKYNLVALRRAVVEAVENNLLTAYGVVEKTKMGLFTLMAFNCRTQPHILTSAFYANCTEEKRSALKQAVATLSKKK